MAEKSNTPAAAEKKTVNYVNFSNILPKDVKEKYKVVGLTKKTSGRIFIPKFGEINFRTISLKKADSLVKRGFPYLAKK